MKGLQKKKGITIIALVITIVIMLLLASIAIQIALGENGLITKSIVSKNEQLKQELYEISKFEYLNLKTKAIEEGKKEPSIEEKVLTESNFLNKYNIVGDNITDKNGNIIDTKENLIGSLKELGKNNNKYPKTVAGVTIAEEAKDNMILKVKIKENTDNLLVPGTRIRSFRR